MKKHRSVESHAHRIARDLMVQWLRDAAASVGWDNYATFCGISWRVNREAPMYGVWSEYPFLDDATGQYPCWDEVDEDRWATRPPTFDELVAEGNAPACIVDIGLQHKGNIATAIEIVHKHDLSDDKLALLNYFDVGHVIRIPASWVLGQVSVPKKKIPEHFWVSGAPSWLYAS